MSSVARSFLELAPEQLPSAGGKGASLARLAQAGFPVPAGFVILPAAFGGEELSADAWAEVQARLAQFRAADAEGAFAVRSSALSEDSAAASFAGEFETVLNVRSDEEIYSAIRTVHESRCGERVRAYSLGRGMEAADGMAVVVQQLVLAEASGVLFTADPVTGRRDLAVLTAAWGLGEAIVGGLVTPDTLRMDKATGRVVAREIAEKHVMTVRTARGTTEAPVPDELRRTPVLSDEQAAEIVRLGVEIESLYGAPMDVEWTLAENHFAIVQARPITALPTAPLPQGEHAELEPVGPAPAPPTRWRLPRGSYAAMRNNIVELMADPLTPLFGTFGRACINRSLNRLLAGFFGRSGIMPQNIIISVNGYAYFDGSLSAGQMVRLVGGAAGTAKRMFTGAVERWTDSGRPRYLAAVEDWGSSSWRELPAVELLAAAGQMMEAAIDAYGALVSGVIPAAWISEALFTKVYNLLVKRRGDPPAATFLLGFDSTPIIEEKALYDLAQWARTQPALAAWVREAPGPRLAASLGQENVPQGAVGLDEWREWQRRFRAHLASYGHTIYSLDFANPVPADDPAPVLETFRLFVGGQGVDPCARQQAAAARRDEATRAVLGRLKGWRSRLFSKYLGRAQRYAPLREDGLADVGRAYPILRQMLLELGRRFASANVIAGPDDIFWLTGDEVAGAAARMDRRETPDSLASAIPLRKATWRAARRATPPTRLPHMKAPGLDSLRSRLARRRERGTKALKGVPASSGRVTGTARVLNGPEDFGQMQAGEILVAAITTPAWTPLFARASAVVTDVGGPLSHGSIVAREYGIPAVLGTGTATKRIHSGQVITVDGSTGLVTLSHNGHS